MIPYVTQSFIFSSSTIISSVMTPLGTFILIFSGTFYFQNVSLLLTPIIVVALLLDLMFLPPLLLRFERWLKRSEQRGGIAGATT